jgi:hypothetical protein
MATRYDVDAFAELGRADRLLQGYNNIPWRLAFYLLGAVVYALLDIAQAIRDKE